MVTGPDATGSGHPLPACRADRDHAIGTLKAAFVQGRLSKDELDARAGRAFAARTSAELSALTADLPAGLARRPISNATRAAICLAVAVAVPAALSALAGPFVLLWCTPFSLMALAVLVAETTVSWQARRSRRRRLPPGRAPASGASRG